MIVGTPLTTGYTRRGAGSYAPWIAACGALALAAGAAIQFGIPFGTQAGTPPPMLPKLPARELTPAKLTTDQSQLLPIAANDALAVNAAIPIARGTFDAASPLALLTAQALDLSRARQCLTEAIYYEAGYESDDGQRAVAQVILNRLRHPMYPKTICGVVYQGSERTTGCQFTFTCDGALARRPSLAAWRRAQRIATEAMAGAVYAPVGWSTNYHANYVVPRWANSLLKTAVVGAHIFYRLPGGYGGRGAFAARYAGNEPSLQGTDAAARIDIAAIPLDGVTGDAPLAARPIIDQTDTARIAAIEPNAPAPVVGGTRWVIEAGGQSSRAPTAEAATPAVPAAPKTVTRAASTEKDGAKPQ